MFDIKKIATDFSRSAKIYDANALLQQRVLKKLWDMGTHHNYSDAKILDAGCGTGKLGKWLPEAHITQLDIAFGMCQAAAINGHNTVNGTLDTLPFADETFDMVFSSLVLQWLPDSESAFKEMKRVVKKAGILAVSSFAENTLHELKSSFAAHALYHTVSSFQGIAKNQETEIITEYFQDMYAIMRHLKTIGAANKMKKRGRGLLTKARCDRVQSFYRDNFAVDEKLPVTWEIAYLVEVK